MLNKSGLSAQTRKPLNRAPAAKNASPRAPADPPVTAPVPDSPTPDLPNSPDKAIQLLASHGCMNEDGTVDRSKTQNMLESIAQTPGLPLQASHLLYALGQLFPRAFGMGLHLEKLTNTVARALERAEAAEKAAEESKLAIMAFVEQQTMQKHQKPNRTEVTHPGTTQIAKADPKPRTRTDAILPQDAIQRCHSQASTVLVQPGSQYFSHLNKLDTRGLLDQAEEVLEAAWATLSESSFVASERLTSKPDIKFRSAKHLPNGSILYELGDHAQAALLCLTELALKFEKCYGLDAKFYGQQATILMEGAPISLKLNDSDVSALEQGCQLDHGSILGLTWAKPVKARTPGQTRAAVKVLLRSQDYADDLIGSRCYLDEGRVYFRRIEEDPIRCLKCQKYGHKSTSCRSHQDICRQSSDKHRSSACNRPGLTHCANCSSDEHASWSRDCPEFSKAREKFNKQQPKNRRRFFNPEKCNSALQPAKDTPPHQTNQATPSYSQHQTHTRTLAPAA
ncbi:hypothetical protein RhiJN_24859 [Ceratobasidium sp. AG-Ba]|nr:hypothetical protein RhiJN_24859 [Ceratobasidium sp. AG-Ba]